MAGCVETASMLTGAERQRTSRGFTLLEILLVMMLATLVLTLVPASFSAVVPRVERQAEVRYFVSALRSARGAAIRERREVTLLLDVRRHQYHLAGSEQVKTSASLPMAVRAVALSNWQWRVRCTASLLTG